MNCEYFALLRHMEADNNAAERNHARGQADAYDAVISKPSSLHDLTPAGVEQAIATGEWLKEHGLSFTRHITSAYLRAMRTSRLLDILGARWEVEDRICEKDSGILNSMKPDEAAALLDESKQQRHSRDNYRYRVERGESFLDLDTRARPFFESLTDRSLVVCHGHVIRVVDRIIMGGKCSWDFGSYKDTRGDLSNGVLIEYKRSTSGWDRRLTVPCKDPHFGSWEEIDRPLYSNTALGALIEKVRTL
ncbi:MAG: phosphoglycerate mutase protein [Candidatus Kaiserbacteria bacterium]|nr:phosphoglycerate mutase protein [Candidatus Kaiserbacteria bacterium]